MIDPSKVAIVLITYYPRWYSGVLKSIKHTDKVRGDLALEFLTTATKAGYQLVVVDGKSAKTFRRKLLKFDTISLIKRRTPKRSPAKRLGMSIASKLPGVEVIILTEPEKTSLLKFIPEIVRPIFDKEAEIIIPKREESLFKSSYPRYMYESEIEGIKIYNEALLAHGLLTPVMKDFDSFFGPRAFRNEKKILALFTSKYQYSTSKYKPDSALFDPEEYSNAQGFPIVSALKKNIPMKSVTIPFVYPKLQKENEEAAAKDAFLEKRRLQRVSLLVDLFHFLSFLDKKKGSDLKEVKV